MNEVEILERLLREDFASFAQKAFEELNPATPYKHNWHIDVMAEKLEACRRGYIRRLIINLPPRHLKSHLVSVAYVAWLLGHNPSLQIICASYGQDLADKLARDTRQIMQSDWYRRLFRTRLDKIAVAEFTTTAQGTRISTSVGGVLTGRGADVIILDDPLKPEEAMSEVRRKGVNEWHDNTLYSRLNDKETGVIIIVMQRLHEDDLVGHVSEKESWDRLTLAAIAEEDECYECKTYFGKRRFARNAGKALHPARENLETLARIRRSIGEYNFASQYQQNPVPLEGALVKASWFKYYDADTLPGSFDQIVQSWDTATKASELNDYSVCVTMGVRDKNIYVLDVFRRRLEYPDLKRVVSEKANAYPTANILIEDKASGTQLVQELQHAGVRNVTAVMPSGDKLMRLHAQTATIENGYFFLKTDAPWLPDLVRELTAFPGSKHDDQVDATSQALKWLNEPIPGMGLYLYMKEQHERAQGLRG